MKRRALLLAILALLAAGPVSANSELSTIMEQLSRQGFTRMEVTQTLLGRTRILALSPEFRREIVFNARTGEILRDYWISLNQSAVAQGRQIVSPSGSSSGSGSSGSSSSSGSSGSSNSGSGRDDSGDDKNDDRNEDRNDDHDGGRNHGGKDD